jgi:mono/diheme cytochrome c family protein
MRLASFLILFLVAYPAAGQDAQRGRDLYDTHCGGCHYERVHERTTSDIKSLGALRAAVAKWAPQTKRNFTPDELADIVEYLNVSHYRIGIAPDLPRRGG